MSGIYTVLARKWRPQKFDEVVGQNVVVRTLRNAIERDRVAHAYLFAGSRGTGKTTVARILARAVNCEKGPTADPCGSCGPCKEILLGTSLDVLEIDGASTRGIDDVRRLREDVKLAPTGGRKKVYIVDEVHMLTQQAFNALLKTLEEPPAHVIFVLATTDPQKLPETILSRCQRFNFARIGVGDTVERLREVISGEKVQLTDEALLILARRSGGALRDALGFLDQVLSTGAQPIDEAAVVETLGLVGSELYVDLARSFIDRNPGKALELVAEVHRSGHDLEFFIQGLLDLLRNLLVLKSAPGADRILEVSAEERARLEELAGPLAIGDLLRLIRITVELSDHVRRSDYPWIHLEVALVEMASLDRVEDLGRLLEEMQSLVPGAGEMSSRSAGPAAQARESVGPVTGPAADPPRAARSRPSPRSSGATPPKSRASASGTDLAGDRAGGGEKATTARPLALVEPEARASGAAATAVSEATAVSGAVPDLWEAVLDRVKARKRLLWSILTQGDVGSVDDGVLRFRLDPRHQFHIEQLREPAHIDVIQSCLDEVWDGPVRFEVELQDGAGADAVPERRRVLQDPFVKKLLEVLDGEILD